MTEEEFRSSPQFRALEDAYRKEREATLANPVLSWEAKMFSVKTLFEEYAAKREELRRAAEGVR